MAFKYLITIKKQFIVNQNYITLCYTHFELYQGSANYVQLKHVSFEPSSISLEEGS